MRRFLIVVWSTTLLVERLLLVLVLEDTWSITFDIFLSSLSATSAQDIFWMWRSCSSYVLLGFPGTLAWHLLGVPWFLSTGFLSLI